MTRINACQSIGIIPFKLTFKKRLPLSHFFHEKVTEVLLRIYCFFCGSFIFLFCLVFAVFCARLFICASWSPAGKGLTSLLSFVVSSVSLSLSHWYPGSGVVLDCIDSWSLQPYLLYITMQCDPLEAFWSIYTTHRFLHTYAVFACAVSPEPSMLA